jgi:hypothetical protein
LSGGENAYETPAYYEGYFEHLFHRKADGNASGKYSKRQRALTTAVINILPEVRIPASIDAVPL